MMRIIGFDGVSKWVDPRELDCRRWFWIGVGIGLMAGWTLGLLVGWGVGRFGERNGFAGRAQAGERNGFAGRDFGRMPMRIVRPRINEQWLSIVSSLTAAYAQSAFGQACRDTTRHV